MYIEIKNIKVVEKIKEEIDKVSPIAPKLYLNRETLAFVLEVNENLLPWESLYNTILNVAKDALIRREVGLDEARMLMPLSKTLEVISHKDINPWRPQDLVNS